MKIDYFPWVGITFMLLHLSSFLLFLYRSMKMGISEDRNIYILFLRYGSHNYFSSLYGKTRLCHVQLFTKGWPRTFHDGGDVNADDNDQTAGRCWWLAQWNTFLGKNIEVIRYSIWGRILIPFCHVFHRQHSIHIVLCELAEKLPGAQLLRLWIQKVFPFSLLFIRWKPGGCI